MNPSRLASVTLLLIGAAACRSGVEQPESVDTVPIRAVWRGIQCVSDDAKIERIEDLAALTEWWRPLARLQFPTKPLPENISEIDFDESVAFVIFMGSRPTAGYNIELHDERATLQRASLTIPANWQKPSGGKSVAQITTSPCIVVVVPSQRYVRATVRDENGDTLLEAVF